MKVACIKRYHLILVKELKNRIGKSLVSKREIDVERGDDTYYM